MFEIKKKILQLNFMRILIVDEHPITIDGYINSLSSSNFCKKNNPSFSKTNCYEKASLTIEQTLLFNETFDLAIIDYNVSKYETEKNQNASNLIRSLEEKMKDCKILIVTNHTEMMIIFEIAKKIKNHGFALKSDLNSKNLVTIVEQVLNNEEFKSEKVRAAIIKIWKNDILIDNVNRQIIFYLNKGYKSKDISTALNISQSNINKKIASLKKYFDSCDDKDLLKTITKLCYFKLLFLEFALQF